MLIGLSQIEQKLLETGLVGMTPEEKNNLIMTIARNQSKTFFEINEDYILDYHKQLKIDLFSEISDSEIVKGFTSSNGHIYRTNRDDQTNMLGKAIHILLDPTVTTVNWKTEDAGYIPLTRDEWISQVFGEGMRHKETILYKYNTLKLRIQDTTSEPELLAISWEGE